MNVSGGFVDEISEIRKNLIRQVTSSVRWDQGISAMIPSVDYFIEIGCGKTLAGMNKQIGVSAPTLSINTIADLEKIAQII